MRRSIRAFPFLAAAAAILTAASHPRESQACGNEVMIQVDPRVQVIARAETDANEGRNLDALTGVALAFPGDKSNGTPLNERALLVAARAIARSNGKFGLGGKMASGEADVSANLRFAAATVEARLAKQPQDGALRTDVAEVISHLPERRAEAKKALVDLEQRNVMASAHGYAALARLRSEAGADARPWVSPALAAFERAPRRMALARCERMSQSEALCVGGEAQASAPKR